MWKGTDGKACCHDQIYSAMWIGKDVTVRFHYQFEVLCELVQMIKDDVMT
jgi:hypothetical protein